MKKRNWLLTIAFAVLSLTIISSAVIGSTFAKFATKISGAGAAQAAGFLVTAGETTAVDNTILMAPEVEASYNVTINYFSQVTTKITDAASENAAQTGTGVFASEMWDDLVAWYNAHLTEIGNVVGYTCTAVSETLKYTDMFTVSYGAGATLAETFAAAVAGAVGSSVELDDTDETNTTLTAMGADETVAISVPLTVTVAWESDAAGGDGFDTFLGNCIAAFETGASLSYGEAVVIGASESDENVKATGAVCLPQTAGTKSTVGISIALTATQVVA